MRKPIAAAALAALAVAPSRASPPHRPSANLVERGAARIPVDGAVAADLEAARALDPSTSSPWPTVFVEISASLAATALLVLATRRRPVRISTPARTRLEAP